MNDFLTEAKAKAMAKHVLESLFCVVSLLAFCLVVLLLLFTACQHFSTGHWVRGLVDIVADFLFSVIVLTFARRKGWY